MVLIDVSRSDRDLALAAVGRAFASGGDWPCQQPCHSYQVVRGGHQVGRQLGAIQPTVAGPTEATDRFEPAKYFLHPFPQTLADGVTRMTCRALVDRAPSTVSILRHVWRDLLLADGGDTRARVVRLVSAHRSWMKATQLCVVQQLRHDVSLSGTRGVRQL